jgi:hypothetical protein
VLVSALVPAPVLTASCGHAGPPRLLGRRLSASRPAPVTAEPRAETGAGAGRGALERDCAASLSAAPAGDARAGLEPTPCEQGGKGALAVSQVAAAAVAGAPRPSQDGPAVWQVAQGPQARKESWSPMSLLVAVDSSVAAEVIRLKREGSSDIGGMPSTAPATARSSDHHPVAPREVADEESTDEGDASAEDKEEEESDESEAERHVARSAAPSGHRAQGAWTEHEVQRLKQAYMRHGPDWESVARDVRTRSVHACRMKHKLDPKIRQGKGAEKSYEGDEDGNSGDERVLRAVDARRSAGRVSEPPAPYALEEQRPGSAVTKRIPFSEESEQAQAQSVRPRSQHTQVQRKQRKRAREDEASEASDAEPHRAISRFERSLEALVGGLHEHESELRRGFDRRCAELQRQCERLKAAASCSEAKLQAVLKENAELRARAEKQGACDDQLRAAHDKLQAAEAKLRASEEAALKLRAFRAAIEKHTAALDS